MKKIYKIIASISVFLIVLFVGVVLVVGNTNKKANAGVIVETTSIYLPYTGTSTKYDTIEEIGEKFLVGISYTQTYGNVYLFRFDYYDNQNTYRRNNAISITGVNYVAPQTISYRYSIYVNGASTMFTHSTTFDFAKYNNETYLVYDIKYVYNTLINDLDGGTIDGYYPLFGTTGIGTRTFTKTSGASIAQVSNLQDLKNNQLSIYYLQDLSNLSSTLTNESTINYGFIDENDSTIYSVYTKYIQIAYDSAENTITYNIPEANTNYTFSNTYNYDGEAFSAWAINYDIYVIWVWHNNNTIKWGIGLCSHSPLYTNNMITNITEIYSLTASNSTTMTCRITDNENLNFITINNIDLTGDFPLSQVNQALRSGGIIPAYAYYQYVSGRNTGFSLGETSATRYWQDYYASGGAGYDEIYQAGRQAGLNENIGTQSWFIKIFEGVDGFLNIRIFPNITFGVLLGIPFIISVVWFIIRMFRGGGSS